MQFTMNEQRWLNDLDRWKTTPEDEESTYVCECDSCKKDLFVGDTVYMIYGERWCEKCVDNTKTELDYPDDFEFD